MLERGLLKASSLHAAEDWAMAKAGNRIIFSLECQTCKRRNYSTTKNKRTNPQKLKFKKYCAFCRRHTEHKETK